MCGLQPLDELPLNLSRYFHSNEVVVPQRACDLLFCGWLNNCSWRVWRWRDNVIDNVVSRDLIVNGGRGLWRKNRRMLSARKNSTLHCIPTKVCDLLPAFPC